MANKKPLSRSPKFTISVNGTPQEIFMSFGLLDECCVIAQSMEQAPTAAMEGHIRSQLLNVLLAKRNEAGEVSEPFNLKKAELDIDETIELLTWAQEHVLDFFMKTAKAANVMMKAQEEAISNLIQLPTGSQTT